MISMANREDNMPTRMIKRTFRKKDFVASFPWREFCEELGLDPIAQEVEIAILPEECSSN